MLNLFRRTGILGRYVFVSSRPDLDKSVIKPRIPNSSLIRLGHMEGKTPRIELYKNVDDALSAGYLGQNLEGSELYVYQAQAINRNRVYEPEISEVPYTLQVKELWYCSDLMVKKVCKIRVGKKKETLYYFHGPRSTKEPIYRWSWKELKDDNMLRIKRKQFGSVTLGQKEFVLGGRVAQNIVSTSPGKVQNAVSQLFQMKSKSPEDRKLTKKLIGMAKNEYGLDRRNVGINSSPSIFTTPRARVNKSAMNFLKKLNSVSGKFVKNKEDIEKNKECFEAIRNNYVNSDGERFARNVFDKGRGSIYLHPGISGNRPELIGHELGHERNARYGLGMIRNGISDLGRSVSPGDKEKTVSQAVLSNIKTAATGIPKLAEEGLASIRGLRLMKKAGANKQQIQTGRQNLKTAFGTYLDDFKYNLASPWANIQDRQDRYKQIMSDRAKRPINNIQK